MKKLIVSLLICSACFVQFACTTTTAKLPVELNSGNPSPYGIPSIEISIQGKTIPVLLDTGANKTEIAFSPQALNGLDVHYTGEETCFQAFDGMQCQKNFIIAQMEIGGIVIKNVSGRVMPKLWGGHENGMIITPAIENGVLGIQFLSRFNVLLDFANANSTSKCNSLKKLY